MSRSGQPQEIVIVGAGLAAATASIALRDQGFLGGITIVGDEQYPPYERPPLSKNFLMGKSSFEDALVEPASWYLDHDVCLLTGRAVVALDVEQHDIQLADGARISYDKAILATGARPRVLSIPGADLAWTLRGVDDSERLRAALTSESSIVVVGGGWIGLETAAAAREAGLDVTVLEAAALPLQRALGDEMAAYFAALHRRHGVDIRTSTVVDSIGGTGPFTVSAAGDEFEAGIVLMAVGAMPNTELAHAAGLAVDNGVVVDEHFATSHPDVLAIGDVARANNIVLGEPMRVEHWDNAIRQGKAVANVLLGHNSAYDWQPYFFTDQFDLGMEYVGRSEPSNDVVVRGDPTTGEFLAFWLDGPKLTAGMNVNIWDVNDDMRALLGHAVDRDRLADPDVPLSAVAYGVSYPVP